MVNLIALPLPPRTLLSRLPPAFATCRKAKLAQVESERLSLEADLSVLTSVAAKLKAAAARATLAPKGAVKPPALDRVEQRVYDSLEGGSGTVVS